MKKIAKHIQTRTKFAVTCIYAILIIMAWPILYITCDHFWLDDLKSSLLKKFDQLQAENDQDSLY